MLLSYLKEVVKYREEPLLTSHLMRSNYPSKMFKVTFASPVALDGNCQTVFQAEHIEPCVEFSMALHRSSNVPHVIEVVLHPNILPVEEQVCLTLTLKENLKERK